MYWSKPSLGTRLVRLGVGGEGPRREPVVRKRDRERQTDRVTDKRIERERDTERKRNAETERQIHKGKVTETQRETARHRDG